MDCPACAHPNPPDARFCNACGHGLEPPPLPEHLAEKIRSNRIVEGERKQVTVLFADVMGSMDLSEQQDPEAWRAIMDRFVGILCEGVHRLEGTVDKFTGDGIMALFGAPIAHEDHAQRACFAALHLQDQLALYAAELRRERGLNFSVRIGLNSGEVVVGAIGEDHDMTYTAIGHTVGLAQRMEQLAEPGSTYITAQTAALVDGFLELEDLGEFQIKGASRPLRVHRLMGVGAARGRLDVARARGFSRFVGRDEELRVLERAWEQSIAGQPQVIGIVGEAGVGKSRLCDMFANRCRARGVPVYHTAGQAHATSTPLLPILQVMRAYFDVTDLDSDQVARERIAGKLLLLDERFTADLPLLFDFLGVPDPARPAPRMDPDVHQRQLLSLTRRLVRAQNAREPGIVVFEDLHWLDPGSELFVANHLEAAQGGHGLTILNFRPDYHASWMAKSYYRQIALAPLEPEAVDQLLADLLGADASVRELANTVRERTAGNPFFIEEVVLALAEAGHLEGERGAYRLVKPVEEAAVPATVQAVLAARIDRLAERDKAVLQAAAVIGKEFAEPVLARVAELDPVALGEALDQLVASEFIQEIELYPDAVYAFRHPLTRDVAYRSQLGDRRAAVHAAVARAMEAEHPDRLDEWAAMLAQHWERAAKDLEAARWHARAGVWARSNDPAAALNHWRRVQALTDAIPQEAGLGLLARIHELNTGWRLGMADAEADALFAEAEPMAARSGDPWLRALLLASYGTTMITSRGLIREGARRTMEALAIAEESGDTALYVALSTSGYFMFVLGQLDDCARISDRAVELAAGDASLGAGLIVECPLAQCTMHQGGVLIDRGHLVEAGELIEHGRRIAAENNAIEMTGWGHNWAGYHAFRCGDGDRCMAHGRKAVEIFATIGGAFSRTWSWTLVGLAAALQEDWHEALQATERARAISPERSPAADADGWILMTAGEARLHLGDPDSAMTLAREAVAITRERGLAIEHTANVVLARVGLACGCRPEAEAALDRAEVLVESIGAAVVAPLIHVQRAELARQDGNADRRTLELREAHRLFVEMGATEHAGRLSEALAAFAS